jgi:hypothetical protein
VCLIETRGAGGGRGPGGGGGRGAPNNNKKPRLPCAIHRPVPDTFTTGLLSVLFYGQLGHSMTSMRSTCSVHTIKDE